MEKLLNDLYPMMLASLIDDKTTRSLVIRAGELCKKYNVPFVSFYKIISELPLQEKKHD